MRSQLCTSPGDGQGRRRYIPSVCLSGPPCEHSSSESLRQKVMRFWWNAYRWAEWLRPRSLSSRVATREGHRSSSLRVAVDQFSPVSTPVDATQCLNASVKTIFLFLFIFLYWLIYWLILSSENRNVHDMSILVKYLFYVCMKGCEKTRYFLFYFITLYFLLYNPFTLSWALLWALWGGISGGVSLSLSDKTAALRYLVQRMSSFSYMKKKNTDNLPPLSFS